MASSTTPRDAQHIKYNLNHREITLFEEWNARGEQDEGMVLRLNAGEVEFAGKPIFYEIPCSRFASTRENPILTLSYYPPHTTGDTCMHVFIRAPDTISESTLVELGLHTHAKMEPREWMDRYEATTKHLTTITLDYGKNPPNQGRTDERDQQIS